MACLFCRIVAGQLPSDMPYQDDLVVAIRDIHPQAPTHLLVMPKEHIPSIADVTEAHASLVARLMTVSNQLAQGEGISHSGYRLITNCGPDAGQAVPHLHLHLLGGKPLGRLI